MRSAAPSPRRARCPTLRGVTARPVLSACAPRCGLRRMRSGLHGPGGALGAAGCRAGCAGVHPVLQPRGARSATLRCPGQPAGRPSPAVPGAGPAAGWCQAGHHTPCTVPDPRPQGCTAPGLGTATLAPAQAQRFVAGWTVALRDVTARGRSQDTAEVSSRGAEAVSTAQHLPADEQLDSTLAGMPSPQSQALTPLCHGESPESPRATPSGTEVAQPLRGVLGSCRAPRVRAQGSR